HRPVITLPANRTSPGDVLDELAIRPRKPPEISFTNRAAEIVEILARLEPERSDRVEIANDFRQHEVGISVAGVGLECDARLLQLFACRSDEIEHHELLGSDFDSEVRDALRESLRHASLIQRVADSIDHVAPMV